MDPLPRGLFGLKRRHLFAIYLLVGSVLIVVGITAYTLRVTRDVEDQTRLVTELFSGMASRLVQSGDPGEAARVAGLIKEIGIPIIITDNAGLPVVWNAVTGIEPLADHEYGVLQSQDPANPSDPRVRAALAMAGRFDAQSQPFAIFDAEGRRLATLHHGPSALGRQIQLMPYLELGIMVLFFLAILWGLQVKKENDQNLLFAGMAKESAHQMGTPLTSIMGWLALLEDRLPGDDTLRELERDVERLNKVSIRFSKIGSRPRLDDHDLMGVVDETITYFQRRLPHLGGRVQLRSEGAVGQPVVFNRDLLEWVLENLIKNGIDALTDGKGTVTVKLADLPEGGVIVRVSDTGSGIKPSVRNKLFEAGISTKERGWGMGLALVKRIVTQYHGGKIRVESTGSQGTTFAFTLPGKDR